MKNTIGGCAHVCYKVGASYWKCSLVKFYCIGGKTYITLNSLLLTALASIISFPDLSTIFNGVF